MTDVTKKARALAEKANKKLGAGTVVLASDIRPELAPPRTSGSLGLDIALGGGFPTNKWIEIVGDESSGKTAIILQTLAANQRRDPDFFVVWVAGEPFEPRYAEMNGCDLSRIAVIDNNIIEEAFQALLEYLGDQACDAVVVDSLPAMTPDPEAERDMDESLVGTTARLNNKFFRKAHVAMKRSMLEQQRPVLAFIVNQWREKIGVTYGDNRTTPGGRGKDYEYFIRLETRRGAWIEDDEQRTRLTRRGRKDTSVPLQVGQEMILKVFKNKTAPPLRSVVLDYYFADGIVDGIKHSAGTIDEVRDIMGAARALDVIKHRGGGIWVVDGLDLEWKPREQLEMDLYADAELREHIYDTTLSLATRKARGVVDEETAPQTSAARPVRRRRKK